ncbi:MAG: alpha/beta fold hydrolase [Labilithrix sp.]|nr:alpha/beta fold hydrolase [Labilithrix sp.]
MRGRVSEHKTVIQARDGHPLAASVFAVEDEEPERVVIIAAATAVRRGFYEPYARYVAANGCAAITFDYRGIGGSLTKPIAEANATIRDWGEKDYPAIIDWAAARFPGRKISIVGHSVGGQLVGVLDNVDRIDSVCTVAAQNGYFRLYPWRQAIAYGLLWHVMPLVARVLSYFPAKRLKLGEDLPKGVALEWARFCRNPLYMIAPDGAPLQKGFEAYEGRVLAYSIDDDLRAPRACVRVLHDRFAKAKVEGRHVAPRELGAKSIGHVGFFFGKFKHSLWRESLEWLRTATTATP